MVYPSTASSQKPLTTYLPSCQTLSVGAAVITTLVGSILIGIGYLKLKGIGATSTVSLGGAFLASAVFCFLIYFAQSCQKRDSSVADEQNKSFKTDPKLGIPLQYPEEMKDPTRPHINVACETFVDLINQQLAENRELKIITIRYEKKLTDPLKELPAIKAWKNNPRIFDYLELIKEALGKLKEEKIISNYRLDIWKRCALIELHRLDGI